MATLTAMSLERRVELRGRYGRDARAMFFQGRLNTAEIGMVLGVPEAEVVRKGLHRAPLPSFTVHPSDMPPPLPPAGGHAA
jgi:hypothetical protein